MKPSKNRSSIIYWILGGLGLISLVILLLITKKGATVEMQYYRLMTYYGTDGIVMQREENHELNEYIALEKGVYHRYEYNEEGKKILEEERLAEEKDDQLCLLKINLCYQKKIDQKTLQLTETLADGQTVTKVYEKVESLPTTK